MSSKRFLPSLEQVRKAAKQLPDPMEHELDECSVQVEMGDSKRDLRFKRIKFSSSSKGRTYRWIYEGKVLVRTGGSGSKEDSDDDDSRFRVSFAIR